MKQQLAVLCMIGITMSCGSGNNKDAYANKLGIKPAVLAQIDTANYTKMRWTDSAQDFGVIHEGQKLDIVFHFTNTGNGPLYISEVQPSCGCTLVDFTQDPVMPGHDGKITAAFNSKGHPGFVHKTLSVTTNTSKLRQTLSFEGKVQ